ncbi:MAG: DUF5615 family PIN-like protein [Planctomycetes bacterium]|nr:DUF5615 family PIN-like protein [Planctomycetota bacterium]
MAIAYLLDENLPSSLWRALRRRNMMAENPLDVVRVGEPDDLPFSSDDEAILRWAESANRVLVTQDKNTMTHHLSSHLESGRHCPGVFMLRPGCSIPTVIEFLELASEASSPVEWHDRIAFVP